MTVLEALAIGFAAGCWAAVIVVEWYAKLYARRLHDRRKAVQR